MLTGNAQVLLYEGFDYAVGDSLPMHGWTGINNGDQVFVTNGSLSYTGFAPSVGNKISFDGFGRDFQKTFSSQAAGTVYISFIFQVTDASLLDTVSYFTGVGATSATFGSTVWIRKSGTGFKLGLNARSTVAYNSWNNTVYDFNTPILLVVSYQIVSGTTNDIAKMWINPSASSYCAATEPTPTITITNGGTDLTAIDRIFVRQAATNSTPFVDMDEIRVGLTWADVVVGVAGNVFQNEEICLVTVDTASTKNLIIWEKPIDIAIASFKIYREIASVYTYIASIPYSAMSVFTDTTIGVNPNTTAYKYKISVVDACSGNESDLSSEHRTIHVAISPASPCGYNLHWNDYVGFPVTQYLIYRDSSNTGWLKKDSVSFGNVDWTDFICYLPNDTIAYLVEAVNPAGCNSAKAVSHNSTRSNVQRNYGVLNVAQPSGNDLNLKISPNPANTKIYIESENDFKDALITVYDIHSQILLQIPLQKKITVLDISKLAKGVYIVKVVSEKGIAVKKLIKE
ncbi:MAG: hypothetical protein A2X08_02410 [Bacteroidetes bacterium GWA2_32_17]|nr:MAG: hypothetical protein A2X08_02410 [Bacteroidetes bacterium GWA2_32_17]